MERERVSRTKGRTGSYVVATIFGAVGAGVAIDALAEDRPEQTRRDRLDTGILLAITGGVIAVVTNSRTRLVVEPVGEEVARAPAGLTPCPATPFDGARVSMRAGGTLLEGVTNLAGQAKFREGPAPTAVEAVFVDDLPVANVSREP